MDEDGSGLLLVGDSGGVGVIIDAVNKRTSAPYPFVASNLDMGAPAERKMTAFVPALDAARATPWA